MLFVVITWQVAADGPLRALDERAERRIAGLGPARVTEFLADLGNVQIALPALGAALAYALWHGRRDTAAGPGAVRRRRYGLLAVALAMAAVPALVVPLKALIGRPGPVGGETGYYPSGHAATAMVAYCGAALALMSCGAVRRRLAMPAAGVLTLATGIGLVLRGYHWPLDVLGSWCLCGMLLLISSRGTRRSSARTPTG
ncbi:phosphatase PAP2 family protein [Streptomyces sp. CAU 1734]|uniref:phosphatase PAP2 family protein n=1 Tax=Streptomyces sp. CAU 1734 TaxID=3140360 RepID=UPI003261C901